MQLLEWFRATDPWRVVSLFALGWLACFFGLTLRAGQVPLIERIARVAIPDLPPALCRYTRRLTALWSLYFVLACLLSLSGALAFGLTAVAVTLGALVLFVGEFWLRRSLFPQQTFPRLSEQIRHTLFVWRRRP